VATDAQRLTDDNIAVFWSHNLDGFGNWLNTKA